MDYRSDWAVAKATSPGHELSLCFSVQLPPPLRGGDLHGPAQDREHLPREPLAYAASGRVEAAALQGFKARPESVPPRACRTSPSHPTFKLPKAQEQVFLQPLQKAAKQLPLDARQGAALPGRRPL